MVNRLSESQYKDFIWSYSRLSSYLKCPYQWYLNYIERRDGCSNWYAINGSAVHEVLEKIAKGIVNIEDAGEYYLDLTQYNNEYVRDSTKEKTENQCLDFFAEYDFSLFSNYQIIEAEEEVNFTIGDYEFRGFIDLHLMDKDGNHIIVDYKSASGTLKKNGEPKKQNEDTWDGYKKQALLYACGIYQKYNTYPKTIKWLLFRDQMVVSIDFKEEDCIAVQQWAINTIKEIENDKEFLPIKNYIMCNQLCDFRLSCEYKDEEDDE